jgi:carboxypeptidase D
VAALHFIREFLFGSNPLGTVLPDGSVVGGEDPKLASGIIEGPPEIYTGPGVTQSTYVFPQATRAAWSDYAAKAFAVQPEKTNGASGSPAIGITMGAGLAGVLLLMGL